MWLTALDDAWRILVAGLLLGAGLPILFALGVKSIAWANGDLPGTPANPLGKVIAGVLFFAVVAAVALGITYIVAHGFGYTVGFDGLLPHIVKR
ncbi:hypothetical protein [Micropruina sonneratiae]|uniref:hypothetical protein n=1 Tax=Micropruina sonneratiae TaxID=2986940 RepID=UPI0022271D39|nr:hypothetical protein [Micropruina sp. KQZ13P-5]MCW3157029.1 hypothetical protein [Micropruina sp. KQZ13P-5]